MKWISLTFLTLSLLSLSSLSYGKVQSDVDVIYGDDDRLDHYQVTDSFWLERADSTAVMTTADKITKQRSGDYLITSKTLAGKHQVCSDELFADQPAAGFCSGFLVGAKHLVTAGHCIKSASDCKRYKWVFNYAKDEANKKQFMVSEDDVFSCKKIIEQTYVGGRGDDYALIELDREVEGRTHLSFRKSGKIDKGEKLVVIGYPSGIPVKIAAGAYVRSNTSKDYFISNLDTFGGNSGSAVFNEKTGEVEGILVRGERDYEYDRRKRCYRPYKCSNEGCRGEDVTRITNIRKLKEL